MKWFSTLTGKFMIFTGAILLILIGVIYSFEWHEINEDAEAQLLDKGNSLAVALSKTLQSVTEDDIRNGVTLKNGTHIEGDELGRRLFDSQLQVIPESKQEADKRAMKPEYAHAQQQLQDGSSIPLAQYELKYKSAFDDYTDERWQGILDSFMTDENVIFAIPAMDSDNPDFAGYVPTHNSKYNVQGEASKDEWGAVGLLSQNNRAKRVFNDSTGYLSAATEDTSKALLQRYPRNLNGQIVETWNVSYPLTINGKHWGGVRVALSKQGSDVFVVKQRELMAGAFGLLYIAMLVILYVLSKWIVARKLQFVLKAAANLNSHEADLTYRIPVKGKDEMALLAREINQFIIHLQAMIGSIRGMSGQVNSISGQLTQSATHSTDMASEITRSVKEMAAGAESQATGAEDSAKAMEEMAAGIQRIAEASGRVNEETLRLVEDAEQGSSSSEQAMRQMGVMNESAQQVGAAIRKLDEDMQSVSAMAHFISGIAAQTGLLALNAAIEAARAGEEGKGFAVVAKEIRKLADQAEASAGRIHERVDEIQLSMAAAVQAMEHGRREIGLGVEQAGHVRDALGHIVHAIHQISEQMEEVSSAAEQMTAGSEEVTAGIEEMARIAGSASDLTHQVAEASERQLKEAEAAARQAEQLREAGQQLEETVGRFKV